MCTITTTVFISPAKLMCPRTQVHHLQRSLPPLKTNLSGKTPVQDLSPPKPSLVSLTPHAMPSTTTKHDGKGMQ